MTMRKLKTVIAAALAGLFAGAGLNIKALEPTDIVPDGMFHLVDFETGEVLDGSYDTFRLAKSTYNNIKEEYVNLGIVKDGVTYEAEYALALFNVSDACDFEVTYTNTSDGTEGSLNGCYGVDAAYLYTDDEGKYVTFSLSGVTGQASIDDVKVIPLQNVFVNLSMFTVRGGNLYHMIKGEMEDDYYGYIVDHGKAPDYLQEDHAYYSYDGHYFYSDDMLYAMLDDYRNGIRDNSVNADLPWYNWYQFVSHRTFTKVTLEELRAFFTDSMGLTGPIDTFFDADKDGSSDILNHSQLYDMADMLYQAQYEFGTNALMMLAISQMESDSGRSSLSFSRNNLFSHAAYDNDEEAELGRYSDIRTSIYSHAKYYLSGSFMSPMKDQYNGGFFGNKSAGMNVRYSSDPYWGEKAAAAYRALDEALGLKDRESVHLGIRTVENETIVYKEPNTDTPLYATGEMPDMSFVILDTVSNDDGDWYMVQSDSTLDENRDVDLSYYYSWTKDIGYIKADSVQLHVGETAEKSEFIHVSFDADGGSYPGGETKVEYEMPKGYDAAISVPVKENALFDSYDMDTTKLDSDIDFTAAYGEVKDIEISSLPKTEYELNDRIDLRGGILDIHLADGKSESVPFSSSMVSGFDMSTDGEQTVNVSAAGQSTSYTITVSADKDNQRVEMKQRILDLIDTYGEQETLSDDDIAAILSLKQEMDSTVQPYLSMPEMRAFDTILRRAYQDRINYVVADEMEEGFGTSGLAVSIPLGEGELDKKRTDQDTYRITLHKGISDKAQKALSKEAEYLGENDLKAFTISLSKNMDVTPTSATLLCTINRPNNSDGGDVYTVLRYNENGDIIRCYTRQTTNTISFMTEGTGEFMLISRNTTNQYVGEDPVEAVTEESSSTDIRAIIAQVAVAVIILIIIVFSAMYLLGKRRRKQNVIVHEEKKKQIRKDSENLEVTQALEILNTEMLRLDEIRKAEEALKQGIKNKLAGREAAGKTDQSKPDSEKENGTKASASETGSTEDKPSVKKEEPSNHD